MYSAEGREGGREGGTYQVHKELAHPLVHNLVVLPPTLDFDEEKLVVVVPEGGEDGLRQVVGDGLGRGRGGGREGGRER